MRDTAARVRFLNADKRLTHEQSFAILRSEVIGRLHAYGQTITMPAGTLIFQAGQRNVELYILLSGRVDVLATGSDNRRLLVNQKRAGHSAWWIQRCALPELS